jgi:hypothetical protein
MKRGGSAGIFSWLVSLVVVIGAAGMLLGGWWVRRTVESSWSRIDGPATALQVPSSFNEEVTLREGSSNCFVTCTAGEPSITKVYSVGGDVQNVCANVQRAVGRIATGGTVQEMKEDASLLGVSCVWEARLGHGASVFASVVPREDLKWRLVSDELEGVSLRGPLVAWFRFRSGIE